MGTVFIVHCKQRGLQHQDLGCYGSFLHFLISRLSSVFCRLQNTLPGIPAHCPALYYSITGGTDMLHFSIWPQIELWWRMKQILSAFQAWSITSIRDDCSLPYLSLCLSARPDGYWQVRHGGSTFFTLLYIKERYILSNFCHANTSDGIPHFGFGRNVIYQNDHPRPVWNLKLMEIL